MGESIILGVCMCAELVPTETPVNMTRLCKYGHERPVTKHTCPRCAVEATRRYIERKRLGLLKPRLTPDQRFDSYTCYAGDCIAWVGHSNDGRYGAFALLRGKKRWVPAHRYAYIRARGPIPDGMMLDHLCRNTFCVNPSHLEVVTARQNFERGRSPGILHAYHKSKTHCPHGHPYSGENLYQWKTYRYCRACIKAATLRWQKKSRFHEDEVTRLPLEG